MILEILAAALGTLAFAVLFGVPRKYYPYCALVGSFGWIVYLLFEDFGAVTASFASTIVVALISRIFAIWKQCPVTIFLISGIVALVPGSYVYWTAYYLVTDQLRSAAEKGYVAVKIAFAIVLGIVFVFEIPQKVFVKLIPGRNRTVESAILEKDEQ